MVKIVNHVTETDRLKLDRITQDCLDTHVFNPPKVFVNIKCCNAENQIVNNFIMLSKTWVRNAYNLMLMTLSGVALNGGGTTFGPGKMPIKDTDGSTHQYDDYIAYAYNPAVAAGEIGFLLGAVNTNDKGILIGSGSNEESFESYNLATKIAHGSSAGQLIHNAQSESTLSYNSETKKVTVTATRVFTNSSGSDVTVTEIGLFARLYTNDYGSRSYMLSRDLLPSAIAVPNGGSLTVSYIQELVYPA